MPVDITIRLYRYHELSDEAKEKARDWYISSIYWPDELDFVIDHWAEIAKKLGFSIESNGGPWWDLYQDSFYIGRGNFCRPDDEDLDDLENEYKENPDVLSVISDVRAVSQHMSATIKDGRIYDVDGEAHHLTQPSILAPDAEWCVYFQEAKEFREAERTCIQEALRSLQYLGLRWLQDEVKYRESEEVIEEVMKDNDWLFHEDGTRARY